MNAAFYVPLLLVQVTPDMKAYAIYYLPADLQRPEIFLSRAPLRDTARLKLRSNSAPSKNWFTSQVVPPVSGVQYL